MTFILDRRTLLLAAAAFSVGPAFADESILTVQGLIEGGEPRKFTLAELEALPKTAFTTTTLWHPTAVAFEGVGLDFLLSHVGATGKTIRLIALNDYVVEAQISELAGLGGILAYRENGREMPISDRGPLFVLFPFDSNPELRRQSVYARCVWQLATIEIA